jgi:hypothetical protein
LLELDLHPAVRRGFGELRQSLDGALKSIRRRVGGNFDLHRLVFLELGWLNLFQRCNFTDEIVG